MEKKCISCGMPMSKPKHYALGDTEKDYCVHCVREDGSMKSYEEVVNQMTAYMVERQGSNESDARKAVFQMLLKMPAWKKK